MKESSTPDITLALALADAEASHYSSSVEEELFVLFDEMREPLFRYLLSFSLVAADSEEVIQDTFLALFQHLRRGKPRQNLRGWLFRVAHNLALRKRRDDWKQMETFFSPVTLPPEEAVIDPAPNPEDQLAARQERTVLLAVVDALPEQDRRCLFLRAEGLRYREIAEVLEISVSSVSVSLGRSLARISRAAGR
ncbi:MAG TPA: sigma-70 family RNA polymerase sigma factor [Bryobacteraceae bacterium]|nr:sigma-70 family RNA polymerase sigma factor [Bryobacteraceae bacterium]